MKDKIGLIISFVFILIGCIKFDIYIYSTLDYFGKYVAVIVLNIFPFIVSYKLFQKNSLYSILWGIIAGLILYFL